MNNKRRLQLGQTASIAAPVLLILGMRSLFSAGPADANAAAAPDGQSAAAPAPGALVVAQPPAALSHEQQHAMDWRASLNFDVPLVSPMDARIEVDFHPVPAPVTPEPVVAEVVNPLDGLTLTATMGNQNAALAAISGRVYRIGEQVRPGWRLSSVDVRMGRIILTADDGQTAELVKAD